MTVHVVSGSARDALSKELLKADEEGRFSFEFTFGYADFGEGTYADTVREFLGVPENLKLLFGISFVLAEGYARRRPPLYWSSQARVKRESV